MEKVTEQIAESLRTLGIVGAVRLMKVGYHRYTVLIDGKYFGIFDVDRNNFVD